MGAQYLDHEGGQIAYEDNGKGPLVICIPSLGDVRGEYRFLTPQLVAAGYRVVTMDLRGQGESSPNWKEYTVKAVSGDLLALMRELRAGPAVVIATSMAAGAAAWAAAEAPELVRGLVLIGAVVRGTVSFWNKLLFSALFTRPWGPGMWLRYYNTLYPTRQPEDFRQYTADLQSNLKEPGRMEAVMKLILTPKTVPETILAQVKAPVLVLAGSQDRDFPAPEQEAQWVAQQLRGEYRMVDAAGHYPQTEMPELTGRLVLDFLGSISGVEGGDGV